MKDIKIKYYLMINSNSHLIKRHQEELQGYSHK